MTHGLVRLHAFVQNVFAAEPFLVGLPDYWARSWGFPLLEFSSLLTTGIPSIWTSTTFLRISLNYLKKSSLLYIIFEFCLVAKIFISLKSLFFDDLQFFYFFAGTPAYTQLGSVLCVTKAPAPIIQPLAIVTPA